MWQAEADTELTLSASPATAVGQLTLNLVNWRYSTVDLFDIFYEILIFLPLKLP